MVPGFFLTVHVDIHRFTTVFFALPTAPCIWQVALVLVAARYLSGMSCAETSCLVVLAAIGS
eukprot:6256140-Prorocentrum_lima.AAC.1